MRHVLEDHGAMEYRERGDATESYAYRYAPNMHDDTKRQSETP
jgi:hypothetical protein